ncbi:MAG: SoxR reducing system RseC family protein [Lachnospiraceae bacterium]|nr:SoxR reducing system RseC family protein [Lachnospiraceae bacterium]
MAEKGQVVAIKNNFAVIRMERTEACAKCRACIAGMKKQDMIIEAENLCNAKLSDWVFIEIEGGKFMNAIFIMYGIPFAAFILGTLLSYFLILPSIGVSGHSLELSSFVIGLVCIIPVFFWIKSKEHVWESKEYRPKAVEITTPDE